ncbi:MAG: DUF255 domain-containing protein, partial [Bacteroidota bacterium]
MFYANSENKGGWKAYIGEKSISGNDSIFVKKYSWIILIFLYACTAQQLRNKNIADDTPFNALIQEESPFLQKYSHNPVNWRTWSTDALATALAENKPIFLCIGNSSNAAAHKLEKELFRDSSIVSLLNTYSLPILVDRDERPEIATYFSAFCSYFNESTCSFPIHILLLPNGKPLFTASGIRSELWEDILSRYFRLFEQKPEEAMEMATRMDEALFTELNIIDKAEFRFRSDVNIDQLYRELRRQFRSQAYSSKTFLHKEKFLRFLAIYAATRRSTQALKLFEEELDKLALGPSYDHLGGGFFMQGSKDNSLLPDFDKVLYDNAQKIELFALAYQMNGHQFYEQVLYESLEDLERNFKSVNGAYAASWDSYSEGEEGRYYLWSHIEIEAELGAEAEVFKRTYNI